MKISYCFIGQSILEGSAKYGIYIFEDMGQYISYLSLPIRNLSFSYGVLTNLIEEICKKRDIKISYFYLNLENLKKTIAARFKFVSLIVDEMHPIRLFIP